MFLYLYYLMVSYQEHSCKYCNSTENLVKKKYSSGREDICNCCKKCYSKILKEKRIKQKNTINNYTENNFYRKKEIVKKYGNLFFKNVLNSKNNIKIKKINKVLFLYSKKDVDFLFKNPNYFKKCIYCGTVKNLYTVNNIVYNICNDCRTKKCSEVNGSPWNLERREKTINSFKKTLVKKRKQKYKEIKEKYNDLLVTSEKEYLKKGVNKRLKFKCKKGHIYYKWEWNGEVKCPICYPRSDIITKEEFIKYSKEMHPECEYDNINYENGYTDVVVKDKKFGLFSVQPYKHLRGGWHPKRLKNASSVYELKIINFIKKCKPDITILRNKRLLDGKEIDIYLPYYNLGIEFNGLFFHCEYNKMYDTYIPHDYHLNKTLIAKKKGIKLLHINTYQWENKQEIVKSIIKKHIIKTKQIYARKCILKNVNTSEAKKFCEKNHLQGYSRSKIKLGLYYNNELVCLMTFGVPRMNKNYDYELIRLCTKLNVSIVGGASKLFTYFQKNYSGSIISYCDRSLFTGEIYKKLGFRYSHSTNPNYYYTKDYKKLYPRQMFQKHKLKQLLPIYNEKLSESNNMFENGWNRYFDCGNDVYIYP